MPSVTKGKSGNPEEVRRAIDKDQMPPVWLWTGPEEFQKEELWQRLVAKVVPAGLEAMNAARYRAKEDDVAAVVGLCRSLPMLAPRRAVLLMDIEAMQKDEEEVLIAYIHQSSPETVLVLAGARSPGEAKYKRLADAGAEPVVFWIPFARDTLVWIRQRFTDLGKQCDGRIAQLLMQACGAAPGREKVALSEMAPEIEKVSLAMGKRTQVMEEDLDGIGRRIDEEQMRELVSALATGNAATALQALDGVLLFKGYDEVRVLANLTHRIIGLMRVRDLIDRGVKRDDLARLSGVWPSQFEEVERAARGWTGNGLRRSLELLAQADLDLKSSGKSSRLVLETTLLRVIAERKAPRN
jgi:DNA polymerase III subunit delta